MADVLSAEVDVNELVPVEYLDKVEGYKLLDSQTRKVLGISADEFLKEYDAGHLTNGPERTEITRLSMLIHFVR